MDAKKGLLLGLLAGTLLTCAGGCPMAQTRTTNQGGGNLLTAGMKITDGQMTALTADEVQLVSDLVMEQVQAQGGLPPELEPLSDEVAAAVVQFIQENGLSTIADVERLIQNPENIVVPPEVLAAVQTFAGVNLTGLGVLPVRSP